MGGFFGVVGQDDCSMDLFYGTDYHSHLGTRRGGLAVWGDKGIIRFIHDITNAQFRSKFEHDIYKLKGNMGIGVISDMEDQPLVIGSHLGTYAIVTVGRIHNIKDLVKQIFGTRMAHFSEMSGGEINPTELIAILINQGGTFKEGINIAWDAIEGSCSLLLLTDHGIYVARDRYGRTPIVIGQKPRALAAAFESSSFPNLGYEHIRDLGPGEIVCLTTNGIQQISLPCNKCRICTFLWVYYGFPASTYEGRNVEDVRNRCGAMLAMRDDTPVDFVAGIPDSGTGHAVGYAATRNLPYRRPFVKYTPTWPRSFMPPDQETRDLIAKMKLIPIKEIIKGKRILFCEDSIVRGTQLKNTIQRVYDYGAKEVHMRPACPPLIYGCKFLNFSRSRSEMELAARRAIKELEKNCEDIEKVFPKYIDPDSEKHIAMIERIKQRLGLTTLKYQRLEDLIKAIDLPSDRLCTYCWTGID